MSHSKFLRNVNMVFFIRSVCFSQKLDQTFKRFIQLLFLQWGRDHEGKECQDFSSSSHHSVVRWKKPQFQSSSARNSLRRPSIFAFMRRCYREMRFSCLALRTNNLHLWWKGRLKIEGNWLSEVDCQIQHCSFCIFGNYRESEPLYLWLPKAGDVTHSCPCI